MRSVGYRIAATTALIFAVIAVALGALALTVAHVGLARSLDAGIERAATNLVAVYRAQGRAAMIASMRDHAADGHDGLGYALFDRSGRLIDGDLAVDRPRPGWTDTYFYDPIEGRDPARILAFDLPGNERLVIGGDRRPVELANMAILWLFGASVVVMLVLCVIMALVLGRYIQDRLARITQTSDAVIAGDLSRRIPLRGTDDEFDRIAASLNAMLDRIAALVDGIRQVSADVAHDLRTPLTRLRTRTEAALILHAGASPHRTALEQGIAQLDDVLATFDAMLRIAELEEGGSRLRRETVDLAALLDDVGHMFAPVFEESGRTVSIDADPAAIVRGDRDLLAAAIGNLLENVLRHTPVGTHARLAAEVAGGEVRVSVADDGPGVDEATLPRLFDRFFRTDPSRHVGGRGLGLSLVAAIAKAHHGRAWADVAAPGLRVTLALPSRTA